MHFEETYECLDAIIEKSLFAYEYGYIHFAELMDRPVAKFLYGPPASGIAIASPSPTFIKARDRLLTEKTKRKSYNMYAFDAAGDLLFYRSYAQYGQRLECTVLFYSIGGTVYCRYFRGDTKTYYLPWVYSLRLENGEPVYSALASKNSLFLERLIPLNSTTVEYIQYNYLPMATHDYKNISISKSVKFGTTNSAVAISRGLFTRTEDGKLF